MRPGDDNPKELRRWTLAFGAPMLAASIFMATAIGTGISWFLLGCLVFGPGVGIVTLVYLGITSDTNDYPEPIKVVSAPAASDVAVQTISAAPAPAAAA
jgi:hypothetical protein